MMTSSSMFDLVTAEPFQPFRMNMASGKTFDVRHPEMVKVGKTSVVVYSVAPETLELGTHWRNISLMLIESIEPLVIGASKKDGIA